jgi:hypothetical protein
MRELQVLGNGHLKLDLAELQDFFAQDLFEVVRLPLKRLIEQDPLSATRVLRTRSGLPHRLPQRLLLP